MTLSIVESNSELKSKITSFDILMLSIIVLIVILVSVYIIDIEIKGALAIIVIVCSLVPILTTIYGYSEYYPVDFVRAGTLTIDNSSIRINGKEYRYESMNSLQFLINDFKGKRLRRPGLLVDAGPSLSQGVDNKIEFEFNGEHVIVQIQLNSKEQFQYLGNRLREMYLLGISFSEKLNNSKSYGLEHLNYKEIQEFKRKYYS